MIHILRLIVGIIIMYLLASALLVFYHFGEDSMDNLPIYIRIPGGLCLFILVGMLILLTAYIIGGVILE